MANYKREVKAAVLADLASGMPVAIAAEKHKVNYRTVYGWFTELPLATTNTYQNKKELIGDTVLELLQVSLESGIALAKQFRNVEWLQKQNAADLGILYGIIADKSTNIIAAISAIHQSTPQLPAPTEVDPYQDSGVSRIIESDPDVT